MKNTRKSEYDNINDTELVEICMQRGMHNVHRGINRETLIDVLTGKVDDADLARDPYDELRDIMYYMMWKHPHMKQQLKCANERYYCPACPAGRVSACVMLSMDRTMRKDLQEGVEIARKEGKM